MRGKTGVYGSRLLASKTRRSGHGMIQRPHQQRRQQSAGRNWPRFVPQSGSAASALPDAVGGPVERRVRPKTIAAVKPMVMAKTTTRQSGDGFSQAGAAHQHQPPQDHITQRQPGHRSQEASRRLSVNSWRTAGRGLRRRPRESRSRDPGPHRGRATNFPDSRTPRRGSAGPMSRPMPRKDTLRRVPCVPVP